MEREEIIRAAWREYVSAFSGLFAAIVATWGRLRFHEVARETLTAFEQSHHRLPTAQELLYAMNHR